VDILIKFGLVGATVAAVFLLMSKIVKSAPEPVGINYDRLYNDVGSKYGVDPLILKAVASVESNENPNAYNKNDPSIGIMQILCHDDGNGSCSNRLNVMGWPPEKKEDLFDVEYNINIGGQILAWNIKQYGRNKGIATYNRWASRTENEPFGNQGYVDKVLDKYENFKTGGSNGCI